MSQLRSVRADAAIRAFERAGGKRRQGRGSHVNIKMPNGRLVTIPATGVVKLGLLRDALREAGLTEPQFLAHLK